MFAPHCPTCRHRVLLGTRRIVSSSAWSSGGDPSIVLRCFCGTLVAAGAEAQAEAVVAAEAVGAQERVAAGS